MEIKCAWEHNKNDSLLFAVDYSGAFTRGESTNDFLDNIVFKGSYNEQWSLKKLLRRFIWHDRIHAKAMYRKTINTFGENSVENVFCF